MPNSNPSPQTSLAGLLHLFHAHCPHLPNGDNATYTSGGSEDILESGVSTGLGSSVTFPGKPSLTIPLFYFILTTPPS